ncbi:hypothetical protein NDU88_006382 [Pleurodeles waltl]|uniref:Uncharacterized protein n=1 Tax=Pleurodeles waltl TaxID=8319 RepID=A0AAV7LQC6_PLEWA|nr:hypothetical protein NDU88_006382 [Pleurodeles waltl]
MDPPDASAEATSDVATEVPITQAYMDRFLQAIRIETSSLKSDAKSCIHELKQEVTELELVGAGGSSGRGGRVAELEHTVETRSEDHEALWRRMGILEE